MSVVNSTGGVSDKKINTKQENITKDMCSNFKIMHRRLPFLCTAATALLHYEIYLPVNFEVCSLNSIAPDNKMWKDGHTDVRTRLILWSY